MAVVAKQESGNVYKTHRILMPDGSMFEYKENTELTTARGVAENGSYASPISSVSERSIAQNAEDVKFSMRESMEEKKNLIAIAKPDINAKILAIFRRHSQKEPLIRGQISRKFQ